jgi:hypothetical protein
MSIRVPVIVSVERAVWIYNNCPYMGNNEIEQLFGKMSSQKRVKMKNIVFDEMDERGMTRYNNTTVNTDVAFEVWGLNIADLERRYSKLRKYGMVGESSV